MTSLQLQHLNKTASHKSAQRSLNLLCDETEGRKTDGDRWMEGRIVKRTRWMSFDIFSLTRPESQYSCRVRKSDSMDSEVYITVVWLTSNHQPLNAKMNKSTHTYKLQTWMHECTHNNEYRHSSHERKKCFISDFKKMKTGFQILQKKEILLIYHVNIMAAPIVLITVTLMVLIPCVTTPSTCN